MGIYVYYGKVTARCQLGHWFNLFYQSGEMNCWARSCFEPRSVPHVPYSLVKAAILTVSLKVPIPSLRRTPESITH
jgi:hypothetical protein